ncbi:MAG: serine hydrolase domain-containing protein, partial [Gammaproteobacteria bacterium]|nr:serine hydrolase domain-containing protein [Gammaproteobacteria bacterium]
MLLKSMLDRRLAVLFSILLLSNTALAAADNLPSQHAQILAGVEAQLQSLIDNKSLDGISIGIVDRSGLIWQRGLGFANRATRSKAGANTVYRAGSLSKLLTATAMLQLEEQGIIDIDQAVSAYIPRFHYKSRFAEPGVITSRHLLTHLSGLPANINKGHWTEERFSHLVERLRSEYTSYPTDFILNYSNVGYSLLGTLIEENTGYLFEDYMQKHIFDPLGMSQSSFHPYGNTSDHAAIGYNRRVAQNNLPIRDIPALGLNTSLQDLARFVAALLNQGSYQDQQILDPASVASMFEIHNEHVELDFDQHIGLPWFIHQTQTDPALTLAEHGGTTINYSSQVAVSPQHQLGIIVLTNTSQANSTINPLAKDTLSQLISNQPAQVISYLPQQLQNPHVVTGSGTNRYIARSGIVELDMQASQLCECQTNRKLNLVPLPDGWFGLSPDNQQITGKISQQVVAGNEVIVMERHGVQQRIGSRYQETDNLFNWQQHFGDYEIVNPDENFPVTDVGIFAEDDMTYLHYRMPRLSDKLIVLPITPVSAQEAITEGLGRSKGETVYSLDIDGHKHLIYSGYIAR